MPAGGGDQPRDHAGRVAGHPDQLRHPAAHAADVADDRAGRLALKAFWNAGNTGENIATYDVHVVLPGQPLDTVNVRTDHHRVTQQTNADISNTDDGKPLARTAPPTSALVIANDRYGNQSEPSGAVPATPVDILDFYGLYRHDQGAAKGGGGCSAAGTATWVALAALVAGLLFGPPAQEGAQRERRWWPSSPCSPPRRRRRAWSGRPRFLLVAVKVDRYDPKVDFRRRA